jgi:hypothetical protein
VYGVSTVTPVRVACLAALSRLLHYATPQHLREVLAPLPLAAFLAGVIAGRDPQVTSNPNARTASPGPLRPVSADVYTNGDSARRRRSCSLSARCIREGILLEVERE